MSDTPEHVRIVDDACMIYFGKIIYVRVKNQEFSLGEISALAGDFYESPEELKSRGGREAAYARATLKLLNMTNSNFLHTDPNRDGTRKDDGKRDKLPVWEAIGFRKERFIDLAIHNHSHFVRGDLQNSRRECIKYHTIAMALRPLVMKEYDDAWHEMMLQEGFALHYLVDMFASGHMRTPRGDIEKYLANGQFLAWNPIIDTRNNFKDIPVMAGGAIPIVILKAYRKIDHWNPPGGYHSKNAAILAALLSLAQHDHDNYTGVTCTWMGPRNLTEARVDPRPATQGDTKGNFLFDPAGLSGEMVRYSGKFTGDQNLHALEQVQRTAEHDEIDRDRFMKENLPKGGSPEDHASERATDDDRLRPEALNTKKHLFGTVAAHILHTWPQLVAPGTVVPWPGGDHMAQQEAFLDLVAPVAQDPDGGWMQVSTNYDLLCIRWKGPPVVQPFPSLKLSIGTDEDKLIKYLTLEIPAFEVATLVTSPTAMALGPIALSYRDIIDHALPMDGNDPQVRDLFGNVNFIAWLLRHAHDNAFNQAFLTRLGLDTVEKATQKVGSALINGVRKVEQVGEKIIDNGVQKGHEIINDAVETPGGRALEYLEDVLRPRTDFYN